MKQRNLENIPEGTCVCSVCNVERNNLEYQWYLNRMTKDGYRLRVNTNCRYCSKRLEKELNAIKKKLLKDHPKPEYGTPCACCKKPVYKNKSSVPKGVDGRWSWQCDHDHAKATFRGWICKSCNTGFGGLGDSVESVEKALEYLLADDSLRT
jgi:hypothetical protein